MFIKVKYYEKKNFESQACASFAREDARGLSKQHLRLFMYTMAMYCGGKGNHVGFKNITKALSQDKEHQSGGAGLQLVEMATSRLATVMPGFSEEEIRQPRLGLQVEVSEEEIRKETELRKPF